MNNILIYFVILLAGILAVLLSASAASATPYRTTVAAVCFTPADSDALAEVFGDFTVETIEDTSELGFSVIRIVGTKARAMAMIVPDGSVCTTWVSRANLGDPA